MSTKDITDGDLEPLKEGVERMGHVIEQILSLYQHSPDQAAQQMEPLNLTDIAKMVIANEYMQFESKQQRISLNAEPVCLIKGNEFALESLLQNLILNANKYTPPKGVISVNIKSKDNAVMLCVEDSGPGIAEEDRVRVFERFYRVGGDRHASGILGCGLGLAIVQHISTFHGAKVELAVSAELGGLNVMVEFPAI
jgi:two-component system sensor histidine kinase QseC